MRAVCSRAARTDHAGRRAVLVVRGEEDTTEFTDLAKTMGIDIVDVVEQLAERTLELPWPRSRTKSEMCSAVHTWSAWHGVDLVLMHTNATPRQLVATSTVLASRWDRVRFAGLVHGPRRFG